MIFNHSKYNDDWSTVQLSQLGEFKRGKSKHRPRNDIKLFKNGNYPLVQTGEIKSANLYINTHSATYNEFGLQQSKLWEKNTLCITIAANIAETAILGYPMCFPDSIVGFNSFEGKSTEVFVHYVFTYIKRAIQNAASGSIQDNINIDFLTKLNFKIPDFDNQKAIAKVLSDLDTKIELNNKINTELEAMAKLIYDYWFVQFDFPNAQGKPYKRSGGKMVFNEELKREIPEGWEVESLSDCINLFDSKRVPLSRAEREKISGDIPYYGATSVMGYVNDYLFDDEYILLAEDGSVMNEKGFPIVQFIWGKTWVNNHAHVIQAKNKTQNEFIFQLVKMIPVVLIKSGSIQMKINQNNLTKYKVLLPSEKLISDYSLKASSIRKQLINNIEQNQKLSELRDWLLPMLMNGQVTLRQAQGNAVGEVEEKAQMNMAAEPRGEYKKN